MTGGWLGEDTRLSAVPVQVCGDRWRMARGSSEKATVAPRLQGHLWVRKQNLSGRQF